MVKFFSGPYEPDRYVDYDCELVMDLEINVSDDPQTHDEHDQAYLDALNQATNPPLSPMVRGIVRSAVERFRDVSTEYRQERLLRQLANDEPKCANCGFWSQDVRMPEFGSCTRFVDTAKQVGAPEGTEDMMKALMMACAATTDLTVCSKWTAKVD